MPAASSARRTFSQFCLVLASTFSFCFPTKTNQSCKNSHENGNRSCVGIGTAHGGWVDHAALGCANPFGVPGPDDFWEGVKAARCPLGRGDNNDCHGGSNDGTPEPGRHQPLPCPRIFFLPWLGRLCCPCPWRVFFGLPGTCWTRAVPTFDLTAITRALRWF